MFPRKLVMLIRLYSRKVASAITWNLFQCLDRSIWLPSTGSELEDTETALLDDSKSTTGGKGLNGTSTGVQNGVMLSPTTAGSPGGNHRRGHGMR